MTTEFGISIGAKISEYLVEPLLIRPFRPIFCFGSVVNDFHNQKNRLTTIQERVGNDVQRDRDNALVIYHNVEEWLKNVNTSMQEVRRVQNELDENKSCFRYSWCPNWTFHYCFSKQVSKMAATMKTLGEQGDSFSSVSHPPALHQDIIGSSASFMHSQSSKSAFDQIMEALKRDDINLIRLYGGAGAGKTTMAQLVKEEAEKLCYRVIMVPVSQHPQFRSMQGVIADFLGLQFDQLESEQGRAAKLQLRLKNGEKILIIFDDVQKEFNLGALIGIPSSDSGCKILLTTHAEIHVHTQKDIQLCSLSEDEAWSLLKSIASVGDEVRTHDVAKDALEQCNCFPKAIVAMGTVLKGKSVHEWGETLQQHNVERDMRLLSSEDFLFSEAAKSAFTQILEAWKTGGINMIGLYGMGGIGKTTLARQVHNEIIRQNALAIMVTVSQKLDVGNMQDKIADILDVTFEKRTLDERAIELKYRLKDKKILIILDDVWKPFDLGCIGITLDDCKDRKILMTTRRRDVCSSMNCQSEIQLHLFSVNESKKLFKKKAGLSNELELDDVGKQIVAECKCLPIALETVGAALKRKGKDEWVEALEKLGSARLVDIIGVDNEEKNVYKCLRVSYDYLHDQPQGSEAQFILLLCSLFPEDYEIEVEDLTRYAFGMKLFVKVKSIEDARRKVRVVIRFLRDLCLLLDVGGEQYVKLHDVVRAVLLWIGGTEPQERNVLTVTDGVALKDLIRQKSFQNCKALSFTSDVILKFSKHNKLEFPNLEIVLIIIKHDQDFVELGEGFFEHMKLLKVLDVRGPTSWRMFEFAMPQSLQCLEHLRTLLLRKWVCSNSSILRDLGRLRILCLQDCGMDCGAEVVSGLKKLRLLDLAGLWAGMIVTSNVIETLLKLEELYGCRLEKCKDEEGTNNSLSEFKLPSNLVALYMQVENVNCLPTDFCFPNLQSYDIHIGQNSGNPSSIREVRRLELRGTMKDVLINTCKTLLPTVQLLCLFRCGDLYSLPSLSFYNLTEVMITDCPELISIFSSPSVATSLQQLEILKIEYCQNLEDVFSGGDDFSCCCLTNLRELEVSGCDKVKAIFPLTGRPSPQSHRCHLPKLQDIVLQENFLLEQIFSHQTQAEEGVECPSLQVFKVKGCPNISTTHFVTTQLQTPSSKSHKDNYSMGTSK